MHVLTLPRVDLFDIEMRDGLLIIPGGEQIKASEVYGILAAPTCTMFSVARQKAKTPRDFKSGMKLVEMCLQIIWYCREQDGSQLKFWAIENPRGYLRQFIGKPYLVFSPEEYGDDYTKPTDIWGYFNAPKKVPKDMTTEIKSSDSRKLPPLPEGYEMPQGWTRRAARRSITSAKFAEAFFKANR